MRTRPSTSDTTQTNPPARLSPAHGDRRAAAAVEFAIVLPLLMTFFLGATDFGRVSYSTIAIANAARSGAAFASMNPVDPVTLGAWTAGVNQAVVDELSQSTAFDPSKLVVGITRVTESGGLRRVEVQVTYPFETIVNWPTLPSSFDLRQTVSMRCIR
jgi:Flp pilus assembly protein TadG